MTHHTHFMQTRLSIEENETVVLLVDSQGTLCFVLTLHPSNVFRLPNRTEETHRHVCCSEDLYARQCLAQRIEHLGT